MKKRKFKQFDHVELIVEDEKYFGVHKGTKGYIMDLYGDSAAEIDFYWYTEDGSIDGDFFSVDLKDLKFVDPD